MPPGDEDKKLAARLSRGLEGYELTRAGLLDMLEEALNETPDAAHRADIERALVEEAKAESVLRSKLEVVRKRIVETEQVFAEARARTKKYKQTTLFGFVKKSDENGQELDLECDRIAWDERNPKCSHCDKTFKSVEGLISHTTWCAHKRLPLPDSMVQELAEIREEGE
jgi:hypothetical protein